uniref:Uncharacterized protein n=1 Tax=Aegilops tauschii subsp. strangulata TaxID=200361 RepID=A0A452ZLG4_AEGTS
KGKIKGKRTKFRVIMHELNSNKTNPAVCARVMNVRDQKSFFCSVETKPPKRTTVVQVSTRKPRPLTAMDRYPMSRAYSLANSTSFHPLSSTSFLRRAILRLKS